MLWLVYGGDLNI